MQGAWASLTAAKCRGKRTVEIIAERENGTLCDFFQERKVGNQLPNDFFVLFLFEAARAVDKRAAWFEQRDDGASDLELLLLHAIEIVRRETPAHINAAAHHASVAARRVEQNAI